MMRRRGPHTFETVCFTASVSGRRFPDGAHTPRR